MKHFLVQLPNERYFHSRSFSWSLSFLQKPTSSRELCISELPLISLEVFQQPGRFFALITFPGFFKTNRKQKALWTFRLNLSVKICLKDWLNKGRNSWITFLVCLQCLILHLNIKLSRINRFTPPCPLNRHWKGFAVWYVLAAIQLSTDRIQPLHFEHCAKKRRILCCLHAGL